MNMARPTRNLKQPPSLLPKVQLQAGMSNLDLQKEAIEHEFSSPWEDSDLILVVEDQKLHVHRTILKMASPVFKAMLSSNFIEKDAKQITLPGKKVNEFVDLLRQIYPFLDGQVTLTNIRYIYSLADEYQMTKVMKDCRLFLSSVQKTQYNAMEMLSLAQDMEAEDARRQCYGVLSMMTLNQLERAEGFSDLNGQSTRDILLPLVKRYQDCMTAVIPQFLGSLDAMLHLWCHSENKYKMDGVPGKCSSHSNRYCSLSERIQCTTCKGMFIQMAQNAKGYFSPSKTYLTQDIVRVLEEMMHLTQER